MVLLQILSDIHIEFSNARQRLPAIPVLAPILALCGDIGYPHKDSYKDFIYEKAKEYELVFVIAGNHEYVCLFLNFFVRMRSNFSHPTVHQ